ncbi:MAG: NAD(P)/FAD-dependent oxidoreductase [Nocardioidaceae bacterium]
MADRQTQRTNVPRVVVVGGGFAGLSVVRALRGVDVGVTLIDRHAYATFNPLLYQVATATLNPGDITWFLRSVRSRQKNVQFLNGAVQAMDHTAKTVTLADGTVVGYDYLVIAAGVAANYFGITGAAEHAMPLYTRTQALAFRDKMFTHLEAAASHGSDVDLRVVVVGGGATGVEMAGALAELRNTDMPVTYPELDPARTHITLMEMAPSLLGPFDKSLQRYTLKELTQRDVDVRLGTAVQEVRADGVVDGDGNFVPAGIVVWASGVTVPEVVKQWDVPQGKGGRIRVDDHLRVQGLGSVFAVGDIAAEEGDRALPQLAQPAMQGGTYVGRQLRAKLTGDGVARFEYRDKGQLATIGRSSAVAQVKYLPPLKGFVAWVIWMAVHLFYLLGNRNRLTTMINLGARYVFWRRSHNAIVGDTPHATLSDSS